MADDIERRLEAAAEALGEYEATSRRRDELGARIDELGGELAQLRAAEADEQADVSRLEGFSLTRLLVSLRGARDDALAMQRAEADAAAYRAAEAQARLEALRREQEAAEHRLAELSHAPQEYAGVLDEKELYLSESADPRGRQLLDLAQERGLLTDETRELNEALQAAHTARKALAAVSDKLGSASSWSTYDTFFGGGAISSAMKHSRLDEAARAAAYADQCIAVLHRELADVAGASTGIAPLAVDGLTRFVDIWFDNVFTDFAVAGRIRQARENVDRSTRLVRESAPNSCDHEGNALL